ETESPIKKLSDYTVSTNGKSITINSYSLPGGYEYSITVRVGHKLNFERFQKYASKSFSLKKATTTTGPLVEININGVPQAGTPTVSQNEPLLLIAGFMSDDPSTLTFL